MITYHDGDVLKSGADIIAHQCNLEGVFGGGLARQIAKIYPRCETETQAYINRRKRYVLGNYYLYVGYKIRVANCFTQNVAFKTEYGDIRSCFSILKGFCRNVKLKTIAVPYNYGCGIATGEWDKVLAVFEELFADDKNIDFQIWKWEGV